MARRSKSKTKGVSGTVFVGFLISGMSAGMLMNRPDIGALLGLGSGFVASALVRIKL